MNKVIIVGRLTRDPEIRESTNSEIPYCKFTLAVETGHLKENGEKEVDFIPVIFFGKRAEFPAKYLEKGRLVSVTGRLKLSSYEGKDNVKKYSTDVIGEELHVLGAKVKKEIS